MIFYSFRHAAKKTLNLSLTFMQRPAIGLIKLVIQKGTNDNLASPSLSGADVFSRVVSSGIFSRTWPRSMCVFATMFLSATITKDLSCKHYCQESFFISRFARRPRDYRIQRQSFSEQIVLFHVFRSKKSEKQQQQHFFSMTNAVIVTNYGVIATSSLQGKLGHPLKDNSWFSQEG